MSGLVGNSRRHVLSCRGSHGYTVAFLGVSDVYILLYTNVPFTFLNDKDIKISFKLIRLHMRFGNGDNLVCFSCFWNFLRGRGKYSVLTSNVDLTQTTGKLYIERKKKKKKRKKKPQHF